MPTFTRTDVKTKGRVPLSIMIIIFVALITGMWVRSCSLQDETKKITIDNVKLENQTPVSIDVIFDVDNKTLQSTRKTLLIELYTNTGQKIYSTIKIINIYPRKRQTYVYVFDNWERPLQEGEYLIPPKFYIYQQSALAGKFQKLP